MEMASDDPTAIALLLAVRGGDVSMVRRLLSEHPGLGGARLVGNNGGTSTPLHFVTDWPGYFPNGPEIVRLLIGSGADPNAVTNPAPETPLHYAASSDDVDVAAALIDGGADIEIPDGSIGTPLDNAIGYACWHVARLLVARGARVDKLWHASALGMTGWRRCSCAAPTLNSFRKLSGMRAQVANDVLPSSSSGAGRICTGSRIMPTGPRWMRRTGSEHAKRT